MLLTGTAAESAVTTQVLQAPFLQEATDHSTDFLSLLQSLPSYSLKGFCSSVVFTKKNRQSQVILLNLMLYSLTQCISVAITSM